MSASLLMTALALVQSGWVVDEVPLATPPYKPNHAVAIDGTWVGSVGWWGAPDPQRSFVMPTKWAVFATSSDAGVLRLAEFDSPTMGDEGNGTGFTAQVQRDGGYEVMRIRAQPAPTLVTLGQFRFRAFAVSCDDAVAQCVVLETNNAVTLWSSGERKVLIEGAEDDRNHGGLGGVGGAALHPSGRYLALALYPSAALVDLVSGQVTLFRGRVTATAPSLVKAVEAMNEESPLFRTLARGNAVCAATPQGWNEGRLVISHFSIGEIGDPQCRSEPFEFDLATRTRRPVPAYPWDVLDCPRGGWSSSVGTFVTDCVEEIRARMPPPRRPLPDGGWEGGPELEALPEAVALSPTQIFVMAPSHPTKWQWFSGKVQKRGGLDFVLNGPSVITFQKKGVTVEEVPAWRFGQAIFEAPLYDDWHLIRSQKHERELMLVRLRQE